MLTLDSLLRLEFPLSFGGVDYIAQRAEHLSTGEVRIYYAPLANVNNVTFVVRGDHG